jgi:LuxR family transcriptional regulator, maltose regulon positive regulatory protein
MALTPDIKPLIRPKLLLEKIAVPSPLSIIARPRLYALLTSSLASCNATILSGRAGTGKSALAIDFAERSQRAVAWYKVDAPDTELRIFLDYLIASIRTHRPGFGVTNLLRECGSADSMTVARVAEAFVYELELVGGEPLLIVLEDLHQVCDAEWLVPFFCRLLPLLPSDVHILITSRTMPPAPLWRMRSKQTLVVLDEELLAFTRDEAADLFEALGLPREQAVIAVDHSHGRAAALSNLAATLQFAESQTAALIEARRQGSALV